ncbi:MAG TPA: M1 family metallopeptidase [Longimicrobiales bacterium]|nr:M1 family metallopeptidase [Longimicrobiales bacterium]
MFCANAAAQNQRPSLGSLVPPANFERAVKRGTRTTRGVPGPKYWINFATYRISARLDPEAKRLDGSTEINYRNFSPDTLRTLQLDLTLNIHRPDAERHEAMEPTKGVELKSVRIQGAPARTEVQGTRLIITPASPVLPGQATTIAIEYGFEIPQAGAGQRMGYSQDNLLFLAYWYPQMAVYDDMVGWHPDQFTGTSEFYSDFANYDYTIDVPAGWVLVGTGNLANAQQVLSADVYQRLQRAESSDDVVHVVDASNMANATAAGTNGRLQWHFIAENVRDVAFSVTRKSNWDAMRTPVGGGKYTRVDAIWRSLAPVWSNGAKMSAHAITFHSRNTGVPYPYPHMSAVEGADIMTGGMEYPMMTLIGPYTGQPADALYSVITHELAHMWYPMVISTDERRYSWMDEGTTQFNENEAERDYAHVSDARFQLEDQETYLTVARSYEEGELMRRSAYHYDPVAYEIATYEKPAAVLSALRAILGDSVFYKAYREFGNRWKYKHPYPWDMWNTFEDVSGKDLDWFWQEWYFTTWKLDQAVGAVTNTPAGALIRIDDLGGVAMPVLLTITRDGGEVVQRVIQVDAWLNGATSTTVTIPGGKVVRVEIDIGRSFPDVNRTNNVWVQR